MISELAQDLLTKVQGVGGFASGSGVSMTIGAKSADPGMLKVLLPAAWVVFRKQVSDEPSYEHGPASGFVNDSQLMLATYTVTTLIPYTTDDDLLTVQLPLLEEVIAAVHGTESPSGFRWRFAGQRTALVYTDRLAYEQSFTVNHTTPFPS